MATFAEAPAGNEKSGEKIFRTKCAQCHTVDKGAGHKQGTIKHLFLDDLDPHFFSSSMISLSLSLSLSPWSLKFCCWISFSIQSCWKLVCSSFSRFLLESVFFVFFLWLFVEKMRISVVSVSISLRMAVFGWGSNYSCRFEANRSVFWLDLVLFWYDFHRFVCFWYLLLWICLIVYCFVNKFFEHVISIHCINPFSGSYCHVSRSEICLSCTFIWLAPISISVVLLKTLNHVNTEDSSFGMVHEADKLCSGLHVICCGMNKPQPNS